MMREVLIELAQFLDKLVLVDVVFEHEPKRITHNPTRSYRQPPQK